MEHALDAKKRGGVTLSPVFAAQSADVSASYSVEPENYSSDLRFDKDFGEDWCSSPWNSLLSFPLYQQGSVLLRLLEVRDMRGTATESWSDASEKLETGNSLRVQLLVDSLWRNVTSVGVPVPALLKELVSGPDDLLTSSFSDSVSLLSNALTAYIDLVRKDNLNVSMYRSDDSAIILDVTLSNGRIACFMRQAYTHVIGVINGEEKDRLFTGEEAGPQAAVAAIREFTV